MSESKTSTYRSPHFMDTGYLHTGYFQCHNHVLLVDFIPFSNNDRLLSVNTIFYFKKWYQNKVTCLILTFTSSLFFSMFLILVMLLFNKICASFYTSFNPFASVVPRGALSSEGVGGGGGS